MFDETLDETLDDALDEVDEVEAEQFFDCPYCWQRISMLIEPNQGTQSYIEDCEVCCNPIQIRYRVLSNGRVDIEADRAQ
jgi:hypothetical protein